MTLSFDEELALALDDEGHARRNWFLELLRERAAAVRGATSLTEAMLAVFLFERTREREPVA